MTHAPIFPNCMFPTDCQCAARGYEHEADSCLVPKVGQAYASLFGRSHAAQVPPLHAISDGSVQPLAHGSSLASDVHRTLARMDAQAPYSVVDLDKILRLEQATRSLQHEAGMSGSRSTILHMYREELPNGQKLKWWLTLQPFGGMDCLYWNITVGSSERAVACGSRELRDLMVDLIHKAAGNGVVDNRFTWIDVPSAAELSRLGRDA